MTKSNVVISQQKYKKKLFNKVLFTYSIIIIIAILTLTFFISSNINQALIQKELNFNKQVLESINTYFDNNYYEAQKILQHLYGDTYFISFINHDCSEFIKYKLDKYLDNDIYTFKNINNYITSCFMINEDIQDVIIYSKVKNFFFTFSENNSKRYYIDDLSVPKFSDKIKQIPTNKYMYTPYLCNNLGIKTDKNCKVYTTVTGINNPSDLKNIGNLIINYNVNGIYKSYQKYKNDIKGYILILKKDGTIIFDSSNRYYNKKYPYFNLLKNSSHPIMLEEKSFININTSSSSGVMVVGIIPKSQILKNSFIIVRTLFLIAFICIALTILLSNFCMSFFSNRIKNIMAALKKLQQGDLSVRIPINKRKDDELTQIAVSFNNMCEDLNDYINKVYISEIKQKNAELMALQTQINPHFLYNTLEAIRMRAVSKGIPDVSKMIYIMATLLRNSIKADMITNISDEIEYCELYLQLFQIRYNGRLVYDIDIDEQILDYGIIRLSLQPIIENYIVHGIKLHCSNNKISIKGYKEHNNIYIYIKDNGNGIEKQKLYALKKSLKDFESDNSSTIGLLNVNKRLSIIFGNKYGIELDSKENIGTCVLIKIPTLKKEELNNYVQGNANR